MTESLPALLAAAQDAPLPGDGSSPVLGYVLVAAGAADLLVALMMLLTEKPPDPRARMLVVAALAFGGLGMIVLGILFWVGVLGGG